MSKNNEDKFIIDETDSEPIITINTATMTTFSDIVISTEIGDIDISLKDGRVSYPDDLPKTAKVFWDAMHNMYKGF